MIRVTTITTLITYSIVVSQPLAYLFFLGRAQLALSPPAYIELRQRIHRVMNRRLPVVYLAAITTLLLLVVLCMQSQDGNLLVAATVALLCLVIDVIFMVRQNVPINGVIDRWSTDEYPDDWGEYRTRWFTAFGYRQIVLLVGFVSLVVGAVFT